MDTFKLQIMASDHTVYDGDAESVTLQTTEGSIGVLAHHSNIIMAVVPGDLEYVPAGGSAGQGSAASGGSGISGSAAASDAHTSVPVSGRSGSAAQASGGRQTVVVSDGLLKVENGEVMILVDTAETPEEIDEARARRAEEQAREELKRANSYREAALASAELSRAMSRIKASKNKHRL